jgi:hypothetical protein
MNLFTNTHAALGLARNTTVDEMGPRMAAALAAPPSPVTDRKPEDAQEAPIHTFPAPGPELFKKPTAPLFFGDTIGDASATKRMQRLVDKVSGPTTSRTELTPAQAKVAARADVAHRMAEAPDLETAANIRRAARQNGAR